MVGKTKCRSTHTTSLHTCPIASLVSWLAVGVEWRYVLDGGKFSNGMANRQTRSPGRGREADRKLEKRRPLEDLKTQQIAAQSTRYRQMKPPRAPSSSSHVLHPDFSRRSFPIRSHTLRQSRHLLELGAAHFRSCFLLVVFCC